MPQQRGRATAARLSRRPVLSSAGVGREKDPTEAFTLAITRVSEIWIGIVCVGIVLAGTDFGGAGRRLAATGRGFAGRLETNKVTKKQERDHRRRR